MKKPMISPLGMSKVKRRAAKHFINGFIILGHEGFITVHIFSNTANNVRIATSTAVANPICSAEIITPPLFEVGGWKKRV
jgi:hypothetical protein